MRPLLLFRTFVFSIACLASGGATSVFAQTAGSADEPPAEDPGSAEDIHAFERVLRWSNAQLNEITHIFLPDTQARRTWRYTISPRFGDFKGRDHVRFPMGIVYGFNDRTEGEIEVDTYFPNPFQDGSKTGIANIRPSFRYRWVPFWDPTIAAASGARVVRPLGDAPYELNNGINRYSVFTTFSRPVKRVHGLEAFVNVSYDLITPSSVEGYLGESHPQDDFVELTTGVLYRRGLFVYGLSTSWAHTVDNYRSNYVSITPSLLINVPPKYVFDSPGLWQVGTSLEAKRYGSETRFSFRVRVRWNIEFGRAVRAISSGLLPGEQGWVEGRDRRD